MPESAVKLLKSSLALDADSWPIQDLSLSLRAVKNQLAAKMQQTAYAGALICFDSTLGPEAIELTSTVLKAMKSQFTTQRIAIAGSGFVQKAEDGLFPLSFFVSHDEELTEFLGPFRDFEYPRFFLWDKRPTPNQRELLSQFCMK